MKTAAIARAGREKQWFLCRTRPALRGVLPDGAAEGKGCMREIAMARIAEKIRFLLDNFTNECYDIDKQREKGKAVGAAGGLAGFPELADMEITRRRASPMGR